MLVSSVRCRWSNWPRYSVALSVLQWVYIVYSPCALLDYICWVRCVYTCMHTKWVVLVEIGSELSGLRPRLWLIKKGGVWANCASWLADRGPPSSLLKVSCLTWVTKGPEHLTHPLVSLLSVFLQIYSFKKGGQTRNLPRTALRNLSVSELVCLGRFFFLKKWAMPCTAGRTSVVQMLSGG